VEYHAKETVFYTKRLGQQVEVSIKNIAQQTITGHFRCTVNGSTRSKWIELQPNQIYTFKGAKAPLFPSVADPGEHYLDCYFGISPGPSVYPLYGWHKRTIRLFAISGHEQPSKPETEKLERDWDNSIFIDCTKETPHFATKGTHLERITNWYQYRETGIRNGDRFGYQFNISKGNLGKHHLVIVDYIAVDTNAPPVNTDDPDTEVEGDIDYDKPRTMEIDILEPPEPKYGPVIQTGVFTGKEYPCDRPRENVLKTHTIIFWPQTEKNLITIVNRWKGRSANALRIGIWPIKGNETHGWLPKTNVITPPDGGRLLGLWWEEPQIYKNFGAREANITEFHEALKHMIDYLHYTGQNLLIYPIYFYDDPIYPSRIEGWPVWGQKGAWHPDDWFELMLKMCEVNNISVIPSFTIKKIPSLERDNSYCDIVEYPQEGLGEPGTGTKLEHRILLMVREVLEEYGDYPALKGLSFNIWGAECKQCEPDFEGYSCCTANIRRKCCSNSGYLDYLLWLYYPAGTVLGQITEAFPPPPEVNRQLVFSGWLPYPDLHDYDSNPNSLYSHYHNWSLNYFTENDFTEERVKEMYDNAGTRIDNVKPLVEKSEVRFERVLRFTVYREHDQWKPIEREFFINPQYYESCYGVFNKPAGNTAAAIYNGYFEGGGPKYAFLPATCNMGINSDFKNELEHGFWRYAAITPGHRYFMEYYMLAMTNLDPIQIGIGGSSVGTVGHDVRLEYLKPVADPVEIYGLPIQEFAKAYRALPAKSFDIVKNTDDFQVRELIEENKHYFYVVNKKSDPIVVQFTFSKNVYLTDLVTGGQIGSIQMFAVSLSPYQLRSYFFTPDTAQITQVTGGKGVKTATETGTAYFITDSGSTQNLTAVPESALPLEGKPNLQFPHGFFSFNITGLTTGQTVNVTIILPGDMPKITQYWKYHTPEGWYQIPLGSNDGDNIITVQLTDGGTGDDDGVANGIIVDQGGPGTPLKITETMYKSSITQRIDVSKIRYKFKVVDEEWAAKWTNEILYGQKETKYSIAVYLNETGYMTRVDFERWGFPITEIPYKLAEQSLAKLPPGFAVDP
jgi:hypothetical protein